MRDEFQATRQTNPARATSRRRRANIRQANALAAATDANKNNTRFIRRAKTHATSEAFSSVALLVSLDLARAHLGLFT